MGFMDGLRHIGRVQAACNDTRHGCALNDGPVNASVMGQSGCPYIVGSICLCINQEEIGNRLILLYVFQGFLLLNGYILKDRDGLHDLKARETPFQLHHLIRADAFNIA